MPLAPLAILALSAAASVQETRDELDLGAGRLLRGTIVKETAEQLFVDLGPTIVTLPRASVLAVRRGVGAEPEAAPVAEPGALFRRAARAELSVRENVERVGAGVVLVKVPSASGSGFVVSPEGHVVTNAHVIAGERNISVTLFLARAQPGAGGGASGGTEKKVVERVEILALNPYWDLALLELPEAALAGLALTPIPFGRIQEVRAGEPVFSIGSPLGLERTISEGIVSSKNRASDGMLYIQTTAPTNPGNSGGPLFNLKGEMIGVVSWHYALNEGLNFAIPVATVEAFLENRDAFAFDKTNPNSGYLYLAPPRKGAKPGD